MVTKSASLTKLTDFLTDESMSSIVFSDDRGQVLCTEQGESKVAIFYYLLQDT